MHWKRSADASDSVRYCQGSSKLNPGVVGVDRGRRAVAPAHVTLQQLGRPVRDVERWIGEDVVGLEVRVQVAQERVDRL